MFLDGNIKIKVTRDVIKVSYKDMSLATFKKSSVEKLLRDLTARDGEKVRLITTFGKKVFKVKIMPGLNGKEAYIKPTWNDLPLFSDGLSPEGYVVNAKIEDVDR